ncbi:MAG TPA: molybdopterin-dependent oxidoreductase, partial [Chloroflexota bacterium]|nr:molybdopterin-dependent oxidoreductase [Chloroflexota bacterium]
LISTAKWTGARLADVIKLAGGLGAGVVAIAAVGADEFSSALPATAATDPEVLLAYQMNDQPLPREHGFPVRLLIPDRYGMKNAKWIINIKPMTQAYLDWYGQRNWNQQGIVKTMSRIDVPAANAKLAPGASQIAGIAYGGSRGIANVQFSPDGGSSWQPATVEPPLGQDAFVRWHGTFQLAAGQTAQLTVRATDGTGALQVQTFNLPQPNGGTGWDSIAVSA